MWHDSFICADAFFVYGREHSLCWNEPCCLICTIHSRLTYFPICTTTEWAGFDNSWCCSVLQLLQCVAVCRYSLVSSGQVHTGSTLAGFREAFVRSICIHVNWAFIHLNCAFICVNCTFIRVNCICIHVNCAFIHMNCAFIRVNCAFIHVNCTFIQIVHSFAWIGHLFAWIVHSFTWIVLLIHARECRGHMCTAYMHL